LLAREALEVLGLAAGATPAVVKAAHRDLVKVWHPDRFGSDARLRAKAEEKLKQINQAYMVLRSDSGEAAGSGDSPTAVRVRPAHRKNSAKVGLWMARALAVLLLIVLIFAVLKVSRTLRGVATPEPPVATQVQDVPLAPSAVALSADSGQPRRAAAAQFQVTTLSEAQSAQLDETCAAQQADSAAHQRCVEAQLGLMTNAAGAPDLSALDQAEHESIESTCGPAKRAGGDSGFNRCLREQMAAFAADPARPDLTALGEADRSQIETTCRNTKEQRGPAAYNRCRIRLVQLLARSR
jgi:hypothetical protein